MHERGLTQADLAEMLGYTQPHIANIVNGKAIISDKFRWRWHEAFGSKAMRVLNGDNNAKP